MANTAQVRIIHCLKSALGLDDSDYRALLAGYGVQSSKDLSVGRAADLTERLRNQAIAAGVWEDRPQRRDQAIPGKATPKQQRMIKGMWAEVSRQQNAKERIEALHHFIGHKFGVSRLEWLDRCDVQKVVRALKAMKEAKRAAESNDEGAVCRQHAEASGDGSVAS